MFMRGLLSFGLYMGFAVISYSQASFELLETIPLNIYAEIYKKTDGRVSTSGISIHPPSGASGQIELIMGPFSIPVVKSSLFQPVSWGQLGMVRSSSNNVVHQQPSTAYALGTSSPGSPFKGVVVGQVLSLYSLYNLHQDPSTPKYTYAFLWDENNQMRNLSAAIAPILKAHALESYKKLQEVVLDHAFYVSPDERTIYGVAKKLYSLNDPHPLHPLSILNTSYQFFKISLPEPASRLTSGKIFVSISLSKNGLEL